MIITFFFERLNKYLPSSGVTIIAYCLMPNHFHLILQQKETNAISKYIGSVCKSYVQAVNKRFNRTGHLLEGKYKMKLIDEVSYLLHLSRYIHLNPVRAKLVPTAEMWVYSSYNSFLHPEDLPVSIQPKVILQEFSHNTEYQKFVESYKPNDKEQIERYIF